MTRRFDAIIIGTGQAGPSLAGRLTAAGMTVAIVERHLVGGTCVNTGCMPTKTLVASAYAAHLARRGADFGVITGDGPHRHGDGPRPAQKISVDARDGNETWLRGHGPLHVAIAATRASRARTPCASATSCWRRSASSSMSAAARSCPTCRASATCRTSPTPRCWIPTLPEHLVVVGGSYIGLEFAQIYRRFGAQVTIVENGAAPGRPRGRGRVGSGRSDPGGRGHRGAHQRRVHPLRRRHPDGRRGRRRLRPRRAG